MIYSFRTILSDLTKYSQGYHGFKSQSIIKLHFVSRCNFRYKHDRQNPFCNEPLSYVSHIDLTEQYQLLEDFIKPITDFLKDDTIDITEKLNRSISKRQKLHRLSIMNDYINNYNYKTAHSFFNAECGCAQL